MLGEGVEPANPSINAIILLILTVQSAANLSQLTSPLFTPSKSCLNVVCPSTLEVFDLRISSYKSSLLTSPLGTLKSKSSIISMSVVLRYSPGFIPFLREFKDAVIAEVKLSFSNMLISLN